MHRVITPNVEPIQENERWFIVDPNNRYVEFYVPQGGYALCRTNFESFTKGITYEITANDKSNGWITLLCGEDTYRMPYYVFARYFDSEAFVRHINFSNKKRIPEVFNG